MTNSSAAAAQPSLEQKPSRAGVAFPGERSWLPLGTLAAGATASALLLYWIWTRAAVQLVQTFAHDDSFYYLEVARRWVAGEGFTFDGLNPTNGFHPLWMWLLLPVYAVGHGAPELMLRVVLSLQVVALLAPTLWVLFHLGAHWAGTRGGAGAVGAGLLFLPAIQVNAMESGVLVLAATLLLYWTVVRRTLEPVATLSDRVVTGVLLAACFLARTDSIFLISAWGFLSLGIFLLDATLGSPGRRLLAFLRAITPTAASVVVLTTPYLLWNLLSFGHLLPISGALKTSLPELVWSTRFFTKDVIILIALGLVGGALVAWRDSARGAPPRTRAAFLAAFLLLGAYVVQHGLFTLLAMEWGVHSWHFALYALPVLLVVSRILGDPGPGGRHGLIGNPTRGARFAAAACILLLMLGVARTAHAFRERPLRAFYAYSLGAAEWANGNLPADARIAMKDAGAMGYFADASVINIDGVINNYDYQTTLRDQGITSYLRDRGVSYLAQHVLWEHPEAEEPGYGVLRFPIVSRLYDLPAGSIELHEENEVYRALVRGSRGPTHFVIWRLEPRSAPSRER